MNRDANSETRPEDDLRDALAGTGYRLDNLLSLVSVHERVQKYRGTNRTDGVKLTMVHFTQDGQLATADVSFYRMGNGSNHLAVEPVSVDDDLWRLHFHHSHNGPRKDETDAEIGGRILQWNGKSYIGYRRLYHEPGRFTHAWSSNPDPRIDWTYTVLLFEKLPEELKA
jgi:hypothetical protein